MGILVLLGSFALCVLIGAPVAFALGISAVAAFWFEGLPLMIGFQRIISGINVFSLMAIPFFIFAGELMFHGGIAMRLVKFASAAVGAVRGGLGIVNVFSSMLFGGISGSAIADISALGSILVPVMKEKGYDADYVVDAVHAMGAEVVIPPKSNRKEPREYDKELYKERNQVERLFNRLKHWRRVANRFDKTKESFLAFIHIAASCLWLK